jgi:hypothetical protein
MKTLLILSTEFITLMLIDSAINDIETDTLFWKGRSQRQIHIPCTTVDVSCALGLSEGILWISDTFPI